MPESNEIRLEGVAKSFRGPHGPVHAVRSIDLSIAAGETVALLGPNGAGKSTTIDMMLGLARPDGGSVSVFGRAPRDAVDAGLVGAMLQTGALIRDLSVRELVAMMASLYPDPMDVDEALDAHRADETSPASSTQKLSGGQTQRVRFAIALVSDPDAARARRADRRDGRRGPARVLVIDARVRGARARRSCSRRTTSRRPTPTPTASS